MTTDRPVADLEHIGVHRAGYRSDCPACIANDDRISARPVADREPLTWKPTMTPEEALTECHRRWNDEVEEEGWQEFAPYAVQWLRLHGFTLDAARAHPDEAGLRTALERMREFAAHGPGCMFSADLSGVNGDERAVHPARCSCGFDDALGLYRAALAQPAVPVAGAEEGERLATLVVQAFTEYATEGERAQAAGWRFLTAAYDIAQHRAPALRAAQPEDDGLPDERAVATWPGGGGRVSHDPIDGAWFNDADGAWVVLFAPRQFFDGLRRLSESSEGVERRDP